eukprot:2862155-Rhodomonas_salina.2
MPLSGICLRASYGMPGTDMHRVLATQCPVLDCTGLLRACHALSGTDIGVRSTGSSVQAHRRLPNLGSLWLPVHIPPWYTFGQPEAKQELEHRVEPRHVAASRSVGSYEPERMGVRRASLRSMPAAGNVQGR